MKKIKASEATEIQLDWLVAKCEGKNCALHDDGITRCIVVAAPSGVYKGIWKPTINWSQGGPIIEKEKITLKPNGPIWVAYAKGKLVDIVYPMRGPTPLIASMRCFVASRLGDEVEIPEELE